MVERFRGNHRLMKTKVVLFLSVVGILLSAVGCSAGEEKQASIREVDFSYDELVKEKHISREIELPYPYTLQVGLFSNPSTGYQWSESANISDLKILKQESHEYVPAASKDNMVGSGGSEVWKFKTLARGTTKLSMEYSRPWAGGEKGTWTFELTVTVK